jgi:hypothetical protein
VAGTDYDLAASLTFSFEGVAIAQPAATSMIILPTTMIGLPVFMRPSIKCCSPLVATGKDLLNSR